VGFLGVFCLGLFGRVV